MAWEPIDGAPKDGTRILLLCPGAKDYVRIGACWHTIRTVNGQVEGDSADWVIDALIPHFLEQPKPTHWHPLPGMLVGAVDVQRDYIVGRALWRSTEKAGPQAVSEALAETNDRLGDRLNDLAPSVLPELDAEFLRLKAAISAERHERGPTERYFEFLARFADLIAFLIRHEDLENALAPPNFTREADRGK